MSHWRRVWPAGFVVFGITATVVMLIAMVQSCHSLAQRNHVACTAACGDDAVLLAYTTHCECGGRQGKYYAKPSGVK